MSSDIVSTEFTTTEFAAALGLPPGSSVTSIGLIWFDLMSGKDNNTVRVSYRPPPSVIMLARPPLEDRIRRLAGRWRSQARHPQRQNGEREAERSLLEKHADDLVEVLKEKP